MVHVVRYVTGKCPVVRAVLEEVPKRHGSMRESMNEQRLQQALRIVSNPAEGSDAKKKVSIKDGYTGIKSTERLIRPRREIQADSGGSNRQAWNVMD